MARIYTKTGDDGTTGLIGGKRVSKDDSRIEAYGSVDELNAVLGILGNFPLPERTRSILLRIQDDLFNVGAELALPPGVNPAQWGISGIKEEDLKVLEREIDDCQGVLAPLQQFILPGGSQAGAYLHLARTVARRAERRCVSLSHLEPVDPQIIRYVNRLSDLLFVLARYVNQSDSQPEMHPNFGKTKIRS
jgi:cob(I)alamin adenosyltransferase